MNSPRPKASTLPLTGRTIVITRPQDRADEMVTTIKRLGGEPLVCPMIAVQPLPATEEDREVLGKLDQFDWLVFTSASAVKALRFWLEWAGINALSPALQIMAVGEKTAAAAHEQGWRVEANAEQASAEGVVATLLDYGVGLHTKILFPRAREGRDTIPHELGKVGAKVVVLPVYQTAPAVPENLEELRERLRQGKTDAITFTSPSAVHQFCHLFPVAEWPRLREICLAAVGRTTAAAIRQRSLQVNVMPETTSAMALIEAVAEYLCQRKD